MINTEPSDITEARGLLRDFERIEDHAERVKKFEHALISSIYICLTMKKWGSLP